MATHFPALAVWWELDGYSWNTGPDSAGNSLLVQSVTGWTGSAPPRPNSAPRPTAAGAYRGPNYKGAKVLELVGKAEAASWALREELADRISALCADPDTLYPLTRHEHSRTLTMWVELNDAIAVTERRDGRTLDINAQFLAVDPVKYTPDNAAQVTGLAADAVGGVAWNGTLPVTGGLEWNATLPITGGVVWESGAGSSGTVVLTNSGGAYAPVRLTITPTTTVTNPTVVVVSTGERITYGGTITQTLTIDTQSGRVLLGEVNVGAALTDADFFFVPPRSSITLAFSASSGSAQLSAVNANAFA